MAKLFKTESAKFFYSLGLISVAFSAVFFSQWVLSPSGGVHNSLEQGNFLFLPVLLVGAVVFLLIIYLAWQSIWTKIFSKMESKYMTRDVSIAAFLGVAFEALRRFQEQRFFETCYATGSLGCSSVALLAVVMAIVLSFYIDFGD
ncbi:hypothetical protein ACFLRC_00145 [Candidatus Altiarchaeota archaeon]